MKNSDLAIQLSRLTAIIERMTPPIPAILPIPPIPPIPAIPPLIHLGDHDLLIKLDEKVDAIQRTVDKMVEKEDSHVLLFDFNAHVIECTKLHSSLETRIRVLETAITKVMAWGSAVLVFSGILEAIAFHFWK